MTSSAAQDIDLVTNVKNSRWNPDVALGKQVTASSVYNDEVDLYGPHLVVSSFLNRDYGNVRPFWASKYSANANLTINFGQPLPLKGASILWERYPYEYQIQLSNDTLTWENATDTIYLHYLHSLATFPESFPAFTSVPAPYNNTYIGFDLFGCPARDDSGLWYHGNAGSLEECLQRCTERWDCMSAEYKSGECRNSVTCDRLSRTTMVPDTNKFYLKRTVAPPVDGFRGHDTGGCSILPATASNSFGTISTMTKGSLDECAEACRDNGGCTSFQYKKDGEAENNNCLLSHKCDSFSRTEMQGSNSEYYWYLNKQRAVLYTPGYLEFRTGGCVGLNELGSFNKHSTDLKKRIDECAAECDRRFDCVSFEVKHVDNSQPNCQLSSSCDRYSMTVQEAEGTGNFWWFLRTAPPYVPGYDAYDSKDCTGMTGLGSLSTALTEAQCAAACDKLLDPQCKAFIFYKRGTSALGTGCRLFSGCEGIPESDQNIASDPYDPYFLYLRRGDSARGYLSEVDFYGGVTETLTAAQYARILLTNLQSDDYVGIYYTSFFESTGSTSKW